MKRSPTSVIGFFGIIEQDRTVAQQERHMEWSPAHPWCFESWEMFDSAPSGVNVGRLHQVVPSLRCSLWILDSIWFNTIHYMMISSATKPLSPNNCLPGEVEIVACARNGSDGVSVAEVIGICRSTCYQKGWARCQLWHRLCDVVLEINIIN